MWDARWGHGVRARWDVTGKGVLQAGCAGGMFIVGCASWAPCPAHDGVGRPACGECGARARACPPRFALSAVFRSQTSSLVRWRVMLMQAVLWALQLLVLWTWQVRKLKWCPKSRRYMHIPIYCVFLITNEGAHTHSGVCARVIARGFHGETCERSCDVSTADRNLSNSPACRTNYKQW